MLAIQNVTIIPVTGPPINEGTLIIDQGKIKQIGSNLIDVSGCEEVIEGRGRVLTPGWIDAHTHLGIDEEGYGWEGADFNETSEAMTPHLRAIDGVNPSDQGFHDAVQAGITTAQVLPGSANVIGGLTTIIKVKPESIVEEIVMKEEAGLKMALGENPKKFHGQQGRAPVTRMGVAAMIRESFVKASHYLKTEQPRDLRLEAIGKVLARRLPICVHAHRADDIMTAIRIANEFEIDLHVEHVTEGHKIAPYLEKYKERYKFSVGPTLSSRKKVELGNISWNTYAMLDDHGVPFAIITDHPVIPIGQLQTSTQLAVKAGLDAHVALAGVTIRAAEVLGVADRVGSIEEGKDADLVLWDSHPIEGKGRAVMTFVDGKMVYKEESPI
ncbi:Imidazolonepropionase [Halobacillus alkaliphilus]|uniref:Imidazolonepropionase n=1 Tax=Halobacillus alkaliphilus TaxID=396056 RepID=A0A1I2NLT1_9BACI|nr:amidohydrolase [Halobacillus alkaliphilus]SFG03990.1 Imidazolonepropionase [Halobacillus alkaliphilus]